MVWGEGTYLNMYASLSAKLYVAIDAMLNVAELPVN